MKSVTPEKDSIAKGTLKPYKSEAAWVWVREKHLSTSKSQPQLLGSKSCGLHWHRRRTEIRARILNGEATERI